MNNYFMLSDAAHLTPAQCIHAMQVDTCGGILHFPMWDADEECEEYYICKMNWTADDADKVVAEYETLYASLAEIAKSYGVNDDISIKSAAVQGSLSLSTVWNTYLRPFETEGFDADAVSAIQEKLEEEDALTAEESEYYDRYCDAIYTDCAKRLSGSVCTYETVFRAKRLTRLMSLQAPAVIIESEATKLAAAMALRTYCSEMELGEE